jgi:hypothetical protein
MVKGNPASAKAILFRESTLRCSQGAFRIESSPMQRLRLFARIVLLDSLAHEITIPRSAITLWRVTCRPKTAIQPSARKSWTVINEAANRSVAFREGKQRRIFEKHYRGCRQVARMGLVGPCKKTMEGA